MIAEATWTARNASVSSDRLRCTACSVNRGQRGSRPARCGSRRAPRRRQQQHGDEAVPRLANQRLCPTSAAPLASPARGRVTVPSRATSRAGRRHASSHAGACAPMTIAAVLAVFASTQVAAATARGPPARRPPRRPCGGRRCGARSVRPVASVRTAVPDVAMAPETTVTVDVGLDECLDWSSPTATCQPRAEPRRRHGRPRRGDQHPTSAAAAAADGDPVGGQCLRRGAEVELDADGAPAPPASAGPTAAATNRARARPDAASACPGASRRSRGRSPARGRPGRPSGPPRRWSARQHAARR